MKTRHDTTKTNRSLGISETDSSDEEMELDELVIDDLNDERPGMDNQEEVI